MKPQFDPADLSNLPPISLALKKLPHWEHLTLKKLDKVSK